MDVEVLPAVNQIECHPLYPNSEARQFCKQHGIAVTAYASLGQGALLTHPVVSAVAQRSGRSAAQVLLLWGLTQGCAVIPKSVNPDRIRQYAPAVLLSAEPLSSEEMAVLDALGAAEQIKYCWNSRAVL